MKYLFPVCALLSVACTGVFEGQTHRDQSSPAPSSNAAAHGGAGASSVSAPAEAPNAVVGEGAATWCYPAHEPTAAVVRLRWVSKRGRLMAALKALGGFWLAAVAAVFLPLLHFILVPTLLLLGPLMFFWKLRESVTLLGADGPCPACGVPIAHRVQLPAAEHTQVRCEACGRSVDLAIPAAELQGSAHGA